MPPDQLLVTRFTEGYITNFIPMIAPRLKYTACINVDHSIAPSSPLSWVWRLKALKTAHALQGNAISVLNQGQIEEAFIWLSSHYRR
jgi:hypothetical protein